MNDFIVLTVIPWVTGLAALIAIMSYSIPKLRKYIAARKQCRTLLEENVNNIRSQVERIKKEFEPNGGESFRDAINRIEATTERSLERQRIREADHVDLLMETDNEGSIIWVNRTLARKFRRLPTELMGRGWINIVHPAERSRVEQSWDVAIDNGREVELDFVGISNDHETYNVRTKTYAMHDNDDVIVGYLVTVMVIEDGDYVNRLAEPR